MKEVSIKELKRRLSAILAEAASGADVLILKHNRPWARLTATGTGHLRIGAQFGRGSLRPLFRNATKGRYLQVLLDDRSGGREKS
jgi:prevent-host-death family protein